MSYLLLLGLFWQPVYFLVMYAVKKDYSYLNQALSWGKNLLALVNPFGVHY